MIFLFPRNQPKILHGTGIVTYIYHRFKAIHVGKHTSPNGVYGNVKKRQQSTWPGTILMPFGSPAEKTWMVSDRGGFFYAIAWWF